MVNWLRQLSFDPMPVLLSLNNRALLYFVRRDLANEEVGTVATLWDLPEVKKNWSPTNRWFVEISFRQRTGWGRL